MQKNMLKTDRTYSSKRLMLTICQNQPLICLYLTKNRQNEVINKKR